MVDSLSEQDSKPYNDLPTTYDNGAKDDSDFYQILRSKIRKWAASKKGKNNKWVEFILLAPDLFHLLCKLVIDDDVSLEDKVKLALVIVYFVSPLDLIPEGILGPMAYVDDIALSVYVLNRILNNTSPEVLRRHWVGEEDILTVIKQILKVADQMVGSGLWSKLKGMIR
ncbi:DUF1232 domain-containing protein [bacterium]|nr:DUF1232 domain-containing protein [bacterium]